MPRPQKDLSFSVLLDQYGPALTEKQREILIEYYNEDFSLAEIAENYGITRQGVRDAIKHGEAALLAFEEKLGMARKEAELQAQIARLRQLAAQVRTVNSGLYTADARIDRAAAEMLRLLEHMAAQEDADGI